MLLIVLAGSGSRISSLSIALNFVQVISLFVGGGGVTRNCLGFHITLFCPVTLTTAASFPSWVALGTVGSLRFLVGLQSQSGLHVARVLHSPHLLVQTVGHYVPIVKCHI